MQSYCQLLLYSRRARASFFRISAAPKCNIKGASISRKLKAHFGRNTSSVLYHTKRRSSRHVRPRPVCKVVARKACTVRHGGVAADPTHCRYSIRRMWGGCGCAATMLHMLLCTCCYAQAAMQQAHATTSRKNARGEGGVRTYRRREVEGV